MTTEQEIKAEMNQRIQSDSFELSFGTPGKSGQMTLKCYGDFSEVIGDISDNPDLDSVTSKKVKGLLKIRGYLMKLRVIQ